MTNHQNATPTGAPKTPRYTATESGKGRQNGRVLIDGELQRGPDGRVRVYTGKEGAYKEVDRLEAEAKRQAKITRNQERDAALAPQAVLDPAARRLDGLTHAEAVAKGYGKPMQRITYIGRKGRKYSFAFGTTAAHYTVASGTPMHVSIVDTRTQDSLYSGAVAELPEKGNRSKNALALLPWMQLDVGVVERYLARATV